ncbi:hypothetical protein ZTR_05265 [Talaromyces verruculosus]|nr:hypothetical protein ZTR_05265 [Talaromyces verruculosus]
MLQHARCNDISKLHTFKVPLREEFVDDASSGQNTTAWCGSNIKTLETDLRQKGVKANITAIPIEPGVYLTFPQIRDELRVIKSHYNAKVFKVKDATDRELDLVRNAVQIYRATKRSWFKWMDDVDNQLASLAESKSHDQQAAHELAGASLSGSFVAVWIEWDLGALDLEEFLLKNGVLADVPVIQPLKYDLCEIWVKDNRKDEIKLLFAGKIYADFDKKSALVSFCGYEGSLQIVLTSYRNNTGISAGQKELVDSRIEQLKGRIKESGSSKI